PVRASPWGQLAILCLYVFSVTLAFQALPPVSSLIIEELALSHAQLGLFMSIYSMPAIFLSIPLSFLSLRFGPKKLGLVSLSLMVAGSITIILARAFPVLLLGRTLIGIGAVAAPIIGLQGVAVWFRHRRLGLAMSIYSTCMLLAFFLSLVSFGTAGLTWGWRATILITMIIIIITLMLFVLYFRLPAESSPAGAARAPLVFRSIFRAGRWIWVMGMIWALVSSGIFSVVAFLPDYIYSSGYTLGIAGAITSIILGVHVILGPFAGFLLDRLKYKHILLIIGIAGTGIATFFLASFIQYVILWVILLGIFATAFSPAMGSIVPSLVSYEMLALAFGITNTVNNVGMFAGPYLAGLVRDLSGSYQYSYWFLALFFAAALVLTVAMLMMQIRRDRAQRFS
ncbi:MAG TPA: MFS transporter, partial [Dehalococcoidia bacterium]|nr:MFS transporter [Dehalococcoidia bacterium]